MKNILLCRRTFIAFISIAALLAMNLVNTLDTSSAVAAVAIALAGSNAAEGALKAKFTR
jgi:hypothetical protein